MVDIFLSYASANRANAETLANVIKKLGWTVWWDRQIPIGLSYDQVINKNLKAAKCVIVLWTKESVASDWVITEASEGAKRRILIPILLESNIEIPLEFRRNQTANLVNWRSANQFHPEFEKLYTRLTELLNHPRYPPEGPPFIPEASSEPLSPLRTPSGNGKIKKFLIMGTVILSVIVIWALSKDNSPFPIVPSNPIPVESSQSNMTAEENYQKGKQLYAVGNYEDAFQWLEASANQAHIGAITIIAARYKDKIDDKKLREWMKAANKKDEMRE